MTGGARHIVQRVREGGWRMLHRMFLGRLGFGVPVESAVWDQQYQGGEWDFLYGDAERAHYDAIIEFVARYAPRRPRLIDIGCGHGRLLELLRPLEFQSYVGVDLSQAALDRARALGVPRAEFAVADFERWTSPTEADAIIFNESLYYARQPLEAARRHAAHLAKGGCLIVSAVEYGDIDAIWRRLDTAFQEREHRVVDNGKGQRWTVKVLAPRAAV